MTGLAARPRLAALVRAWLAASGNAALQRAQQELEQAALPWIDACSPPARPAVPCAPTSRPAS